MTAPQDKVLTGIARVQVAFLIDIVPEHSVCTEAEFREAARKKIRHILRQDQWHTDKFDVGEVTIVLDPPAESSGD